MSAATLQALISDLEGATGPDWRINHDIAVLMGWRESRPGVDYTGSVDAALSLVPEDLWIEIVRRRAHTSGPRAHARLHLSGEDGLRVDGTGPTIAIAICAAALKARMAQETDRG